MFNLVKENPEYTLFDYPAIRTNNEEFCRYALVAKKRLKFVYNKASTTWLYRYYNFASLVVGSIEYHNFFRDLNELIKSHCKTNQRLWYQCWFNYHKPNEVLDWHTHNDCEYHGFISIDPKKTKTIFENFEVENKPGLMCISKPQKHKVVVLKPFQGHRITVAFDILTEENVKESIKKNGEIDMNLSFLPVI